ncbi:MAG: alpha/beta hydrolase [Acidimicrobiales bacterium]|nr:alpha/beta hydrolase [Acidimicrobiales bacterium]
MPFAQVSPDVKICYELFGNSEDPTLVLLHGLGSQLLLWEEGFCIGLAAQGFQVVRFDSRDSGLSTQLSEGSAYTLSNMAVDVVGLLDHLEVGDAHIVGFSLGGMVAQTVAVDHPERCRSLVSMGSNTGNREFGQPSGETMAAMMATVPEGPAARLEKDLADRRLWASPAWHDDELALATFAAYAERFPQPQEAFERQYGAAVVGGDREKQLAAITVPTRVVHGGADTLIDQSGGRRTAEVVPGADFVLIDGWGHDLPPGAWPFLIEAISEHALRCDAQRVD